MPTPIPIDPAERAEAENAARELLRDLIGTDNSDTTLRVCADHLLSFRRHPKTQAEQPPTAALDRLFAIAKSDTGQSARVAKRPAPWRSQVAASGKGMSSRTRTLRPLTRRVTVCCSQRAILSP